MKAIWSRPCSPWKIEPSDEAEDVLEVRRRQDLALDDRAGHVGRVAGQVLDAGVGVALARVALRPGLSLGRAVLGEHRHHPAAVVGEAGVDRRGQLGLDVRARPRDGPPSASCQARSR